MNFKCTLLIIFAFLHSIYVRADDPKAGKTLLAKGRVEALSSDSQLTRSLKRKSPIYKVDKITTFNDSQTQIKMLDGALVALKSNTQLNIEKYLLSTGDEDSAVVMELVSGGLRTITGKIKGRKNNYILKTPVGSIGIRGTHYEAEIVNGDLLLAVWDGSVEITGNKFNEQLVLGREGTHAFAKITSLGDVLTLLKPPKELSALSDLFTNSTEEEIEAQFNEYLTAINLAYPSLEVEELLRYEAPLTEKIQKAIGDTNFINENLLDLLASDNNEELIANKSGSVSYSDIERFEIVSTNGSVRDFKMNFKVDFDDGVVPVGELSFSDDSGEWFAAFNGVINTESMRLGVNYASHGQNLAFGNIEAQFSDQLSKLRGGFNLYEINDLSVSASGLFIVKEK